MTFRSRSASRETHSEEEGNLEGGHALCTAFHCTTLRGLYTLPTAEHPPRARADHDCHASSNNPPPCSNISSSW